MMNTEATKASTIIKFLSQPIIISLPSPQKNITTQISHILIWQSQYHRSEKSDRPLHGLSEVRFCTRQVLTSDRKFKIFDLTSDFLYIKFYRRFFATFAQILMNKIPRVGLLNIMLVYVYGMQAQHPYYYKLDSENGFPSNEVYEIK
ncbi:MAG: hypothetical protein AAF806_02305 [Bacteroidota bacterium]